MDRSRLQKILKILALATLDAFWLLAFSASVGSAALHPYRYPYLVTLTDGVGLRDVMLKLLLFIRGSQNWATAKI